MSYGSTLGHGVDILDVANLCIAFEFNLCDSSDLGAQIYHIQTVWGTELEALVYQYLKMNVCYVCTSMPSQEKQNITKKFTQFQLKQKC